MSALAEHLLSSKKHADGSFRAQMVALRTLVSREVRRTFRLWLETLMPPVITTGLYFLIFGRLIGGRIGNMHGISYTEFIFPGLVMLTINTNSYMHCAYSVFIARFQRFIEELLVSPATNAVILTGYCFSAVIRGLLTGIMVALVASFFTPLHIAHPLWALVICCLTAGIFSMMGFCNALLAKNFDSLSVITNFLITPLTYLGGVFYSIQLLPSLGQKLALFNPIVYLISALRSSILGFDDIPFSRCFSILLIWFFLQLTLNIVLLRRGTGLRS